MGVKLPHYTQSRVSMEEHEPVFVALFDLQVQPPASIANGQWVYVQECIKKISGLDGLEKQPGLVTQKFKSATRTFAGAVVDDTSVELTLDFEVNMNDAGQAYTYSIMRAWTDLIYDPATGRTAARKSDYKGSMILTEYARNSVIWRQLEFPIIFPAGPISGFMGEHDHTSNDIATFSLTFKADYWIPLLR